MKLQHIAAILLMFACSLTTEAQTKSKASNAHRRAHREQLANLKNRIDKGVIADFIKNDVKNRESKIEGGMSASVSEMLDDILKEANKHLGKRYRRGSKGPHTFDCSGFSSYVYKQFGYSLSPSSRAQFTQGSPVKRNELRKGDLVFFTGRNSRGGVGHVGIVVSADNASGDFKFIHAATGGIMVNSCSGYYEGRYLGARRVIKDDDNN